MHRADHLAILALLLTAVRAQEQAWWQPPAGTTWAIDLSETLSPPFANATAVDGDLFANNGSAWSTVTSAGYKTICYFSAGSYENWRPDKDDFQHADIGEPLDDWPGEAWVDTNSANVRAIMERRMDLAVQNGCDAIDPDNIDAFNNGGGGFNLTTTDAISYVQFLGSEGHKRGLAVGLKNGGDVLQDVLASVDFQVNEQCLQYNECTTSRPFIDVDKPVFEIEYRDSTPSQATVDSICTAPSRKGFSTLIKHMNLDSWQVACAIISNGTVATNRTSTTTQTTTTAQSTHAQPTNSAGAMKAPVVASVVVALILAGKYMQSCNR